MTQRQQTAEGASAREQGLALLVVLWIIVAAALIVSAFNATVRSGVSFVGSEVELSKTEALLDAGLEIAAAHLVEEEEERRWVADGRLYRVAFAGANLAIAIRDTSGYIDINKADKELLMGLLRRFAGSEANARRLRDRILVARGTPPGEQKKQAKQDVNADGEPASDPSADAPVFVDVSQLRGVEGMTPELYAVLAPLLTVYSGDGRINPKAAPDEVLAAIPGLNRGDIETLRSAVSSSRESDAKLIDLSHRVGAYVTDRAGPAYLVTVEVLRPDRGRGASSVYVIAPGLDGVAPYRLIAKRPVETGQVRGAG